VQWQTSSHELPIPRATDISRISTRWSQVIRRLLGHQLHLHFTSINTVILCTHVVHYLLQNSQHRTIDWVLARLVGIGVNCLFFIERRAAVLTNDTYIFICKRITCLFAVFRSGCVQGCACPHCRLWHPLALSVTISVTPFKLST